jgi:hypothetical protein
MAALEATLANARAGRPIREPESDGAGDLENLDRDALYQRASKAGVPGRSKMSKKQLIKAPSQD